MPASWQDRSSPYPSSRAVAAVWIVVLLMVAVSCVAMARPVDDQCGPPNLSTCEQGATP